jgi:uncharacterized protein YjbJ (UPF0337 family)
MLEETGGAIARLESAESAPPARAGERPPSAPPSQGRSGPGRPVARAVARVGHARNRRQTWSGKQGEIPMRSMNQDQAQGMWDQVKGKAKRIWGELTDDDFLKAEGSVDKLYGIITEKFGDAKDAIQRKLDDTHMP